MNVSQSRIPRSSELESPQRVDEPARSRGSAPPSQLSTTNNGARPTRSETTRARLLEAGRDLFAEHGPHDVTSHAIAARAGYAAGTFYLHFKDKFALFRELAENAASELEDRLHALEDDETDAYIIMKAQADVLVGFAEDQRALLRIMFHPGSEVAGIGSGILERLAQGLSQRRQEAVAAGFAQDCFDSDVLAQAIVGMWAHVLAWWAEDPSRAGREAIVDTLTHFQLHGNRAETGSRCEFSELTEGESPR